MTHETTAPAAEQGKNGLLPCPFCGKKEMRTYRRTIGQDWEWIVECEACEAKTTAVNEHRARADWNRRAPTPPAQQSQAAIDVLTERRRQIEAEGWTPEHDDKYLDDELAMAAVSYLEYSPELCGPEAPSAWPWDDAWWKPSDRRRDLIKAGALILAEIERLDRATASGDTAAQEEQAEQPKCSMCRDVGIIGHSEICPACADSWQPPAERVKEQAEQQCPQCAGTGYDCPDCINAAEQDAVTVPRKALENAIERMEGMILQLGMEFGSKSFDELREEGDEDLKAADALRALLRGGE